MKYLKKDSTKHGYTPIVTKGDGNLKLLSLGLLKLNAGESWSLEKNAQETALVVLSGTISVTGDDFSFEKVGVRADVFSGKPDTVFIPAFRDAFVSATVNAEIAICAAASEKTGPVARITPEGVVEKSLGKDNWQRRAHMVIGGNIDADVLFLGEAIVPSGNWGSYPPHCHDKSDPPNEVDMEEYYFFKFKPRNGFGVQIMYSEDKSMDLAMNVYENDTTLLPAGYHPVVAAPGYGMYYLWVMAGKDRQFLQTIDPAHKWLLE